LDLPPMSFASVAAFRVTLVLALVFASLAIANAQASTVHPDTPIDRAERCVTGTRQ